MQKLIKTILDGGQYGKYDLTGIRLNIQKLENIPINRLSKQAIKFLAYVRKIRERVTPYMQHTFSNRSGASNCGRFQSFLLKTLSTETLSPDNSRSVASFIKHVTQGVEAPKIYHFTFGISKTSAAGHFFSIILRPNRRPYIIQEELNTYNLFQYVMYNLMRGIKNPLSKDPKRVIDFFEEAQKNEQVPVNLFAYMFGYVWHEKDRYVPIYNLRVTGVTTTNNRVDFDSFINSISHSPVITNASSYCV